MNTLRTIVVVSVGLIVALWWAVLRPRKELEIRPPVAVSQQQQCPAGARLEGKLCMCAQGSAWTGSACATEAYDPNQPDRRHVTTVDLRR
jgi:hypothetical protein